MIKLNAADADYTYDNTKLIYSIKEGNEARKFSITDRTGEILLVASLDRERSPSYTLTVAVSDNGSPSLTSSTQVRIARRNHVLYTEDVGIAVTRVSVEVFRGVILQWEYPIFQRPNIFRNMFGILCRIFPALIVKL